MKYSRLFGKTVRNAKRDMTTPSHKLLYQGGFIRQSTAGRYFFLPLGMRVRKKVISIIRDEMNASGACEMLVPILHPIELWKETNRTESVGFELTTVKDRRGAKFALGGTAEEMFTDLVRGFKLSYKDLPFNIYQFSQKFRDELRASGGLLRVREFTMKDAYSFNRNEKEFKKEYKIMWNTYEKIFKRFDLDAKPVEADNGYIGGDYCHEFVVDSDVGESKYLVPKDGKHAAHEEIAKFKRDKKNTNEKKKKMIEVEAKRGNTMQDGVKLHKLPLWQQIKDVMFVNEKEEMILAIIRGDLEVNEIKVARLTKSYELRHATDKEIRSIGSEPGFISPIGISKKIKTVGDISLRTINNAYTGANKKHKDFLNVNIDRDYKLDIEDDIGLAKEGYLTQDGKKKLIKKVGIEVGNIFQLGYHYSKKMNDATFTDKDGKEKPFYMGCYGIGIGRNIATIVELHHDDKGIIWPISVAPFKVHLISLDGEEVKTKAEDLYNQMQKAGIEILWDDREDAQAGEKFSDSDLIGIPIRLVISKRSLSRDGVEMKLRSEEKGSVYELDKIVDITKQKIGILSKELK
ncbi:proline--tRNA ligase [Patescibacteria group bacterium]